MRNKVDYGIDLGTTNSAVARMERGEPVIRKSDTLKDTIPSCVHFTRKKDVLVGDQAVSVMKNDNIRALKSFEKQKSNTFIEFKRTMGTTTSYYSSNIDEEYSSEELSAEVLRTLKSFITDELVSSVVVTVPAKFLNSQTEATMRAAKLAGFNQVQLLQEPVAAATAYGLHTKIKDGYFLVFDFGGGTFDAALLKSEEGILSIRDTDGDNWLGGKNIDEAIVDLIIMPYLREKYQIENIVEDPEKLEILRTVLKPLAEEAKIQMSFKNTHNILTNMGDLPFKDENGEEPEVDINVDQKDIERVVAPIFQKAIDITKSVLQRNNLKYESLNTLILVGGPTYSPVLRRMLREQITENIDASVDPMTVVAKGAALFASTISVSQEIQEQTRDKTKLQLEVKHESATVETEGLINIKVLPEKSRGLITKNLYVELIRKPEGFSSTRKKISEKAVLIDVLLVENCPNEFEIRIFDDQGNRVACQPESLTILQGIGGIDSMQVLPYNICIVKYFTSEEKDLIYPVKGLEKNKSVKLGITGIADNLRTRKEIRPGVKNDIIRIPIYQGEYHAQGTNPELNFHIRDVIITGETIPKLLPEGSPFDITIKIDSSSLMTFIARFPTIEHEEEVKIEIKEASAPSIKVIEDKLKSAKMRAEEFSRSDLNSRLEELYDQLKSVGTTDDGRLRLMNDYRIILLDIEEEEKRAQWPKTEEELKSVFFEFEELINKIKSFGDGEKVNYNKIKEHLEEYRKKIEKIIKDKNIKTAKELIQEIGKLDFELRNAVTNNGMDTQYLKELNDNFNSFDWRDPNKARQLINQGIQMVNQKNTTNLRSVLVQLVQLLPREDEGETPQ